MTRSLRHILAALACLALCGALLAACGDDEEKDAGARALLDETFGSGAAAIENGRLDVDFQLVLATERANLLCAHLQQELPCNGKQDRTEDERQCFHLHH